MSEDNKNTLDTVDDKEKEVNPDVNPDEKKDEREEVCYMCRRPESQAG